MEGVGERAGVRSHSASAARVGPGNLIGAELVGWVSLDQDAFILSSNLLAPCKALSCLCSKIVAISSPSWETSGITKPVGTLVMVCQVLALVPGWKLLCPWLVVVEEVEAANL